MKKLYYLVLCLLFACSLSAQKDIPSRWINPGISPERTYPIDSCLYFQLPMNFRVVKVQSGSGEGGGLISIAFRSSDPGGPVFQGRGRIILNDTLLLSGWQWSPGQTGKGAIILPDSAFGSGPGADNFSFPLPANGFILEIIGIIVDPPFPIVIQVRDLTTDL